MARRITGSGWMPLFHGERYWVAPDAPPLTATLPLGDAAAWCRFCGGRRVSESTETNAFRVALPGGAVVYFKRYVYRGVRWRYLVRRSRALCERRGLEAMRRAGVPCAEPLAAGEWRRLGALRAAFLVTRELPDTLDLRAFAETELPRFAASERAHSIRAIGRRVVAELARLHAAGLTHRDLKWRNILVRRRASDWRCWFIDCPRFSSARLNRERNRRLDLSALARGAVLYLPAVSRLRFLLLYSGRDVRRARRLLRWIDRHLARRPPSRKRLPDHARPQRPEDARHTARQHAD